MRHKIPLRSTFEVLKVTDHEVVIRDLDQGMSITNDAENVVKYLSRCYPNHRIFYKDTAGDWAELGHSNGVFTDFIFMNGEQLAAIVNMTVKGK